MKAILKLDAGENAWLTAETKSKLQAAMNAARVDLYPDSAAEVLCTKIAMLNSVERSQVMVGNGSDELIDLCCRLFLKNGGTLIDCEPTFPMYAYFANALGAKCIVVKRDETYRLQLQPTIQALREADLLFVATPNNPTGTITSMEEIRQLLEIGKPVVVDEAYLEFGGTTALPLLREFPNLIVLRTFSKWAGIAGTRVGYLIARPEVVKRLRERQAPYSVNAIAQAAALCALEIKDEILPVVESLKESREWFIKTLQSEKGVTVIPSQASCVCVGVQGKTSNEVVADMAQQQIVVKPLTQGGVENFVRISVAPRPQMERVVEAIRQIKYS